jgi:hypothetical protein
LFTAAWALILILAGAILIAVPSRVVFFALMVAVLLAGGAVTVLDGLLRRGRRWGWRVGIGLVGMWPGVALIVDIAVFYPTGSEPGLAEVSLGSTVPAALTAILLSLSSWRRVSSAMLGAVQFGLLVASAALVALPLTCALGHKTTIFGCAETTVTGVGVATIAGGLAVLAALVARLPSGR